MKAKKLPKTIYVAWTKDNSPGTEPWLEASKDPAFQSEVDETHEVAEFKFVRMVKVINKTTIE